MNVSAEDAFRNAIARTGDWNPSQLLTGLAHSLPGAFPLRFKGFNGPFCLSHAPYQDSHFPGALVLIHGDRPTERSRIEFYRHEFFLHVLPTQDHASPLAFIGVEPHSEISLPAEWGPNASGFGHLVLLPQENRTVLLVTGLQKIMRFSLSSRNRGLKRQRGIRVASDPHQTQGANRHFAVIDYALEIASRMRQQGVPIEVHVPHPSVIPNRMSGVDSSTLDLVRRPFDLLSKKYRADEVQLPHASLKTVNLSRLREPA